MSRCQRSSEVEALHFSPSLLCLYRKIVFRLFALSFILKLLCSPWNRNYTHTNQAEQVISAPFVSVSLSIQWEFWNIYKSIGCLQTENRSSVYFLRDTSWYGLHSFSVCQRSCQKDTEQLAFINQHRTLKGYISTHKAVSINHQKTYGWSKEQKHSQHFPGF